MGSRVSVRDERCGGEIKRCCLLALLGLCAISCSVNEPPAPPVSPAARAQRTAAAPFAGWLHGPNPQWSAKAADRGPEQLIGAACISHLGCEFSAPSLPQCTPASALPAGYIEVRGLLSRSPYIFMGGPQHVLMCAGLDRTTLTVKTATAEYDLGVGCVGDRTGWCCPYAAGTAVHAVGHVWNDRGISRLDDYWLCAESAPKVPDRAPTTEFVALRLGQPPGYATWSAGSTLATWDFERGRAFQLHSDGQKPFVCADLDPTGKRLFSIDRAGDGAVWKLDTGEREAILQNFAPGARTQPYAPDVSCTYELANAVAWAPNGGALLLESASGAASVYTAGSAAFQILPSRIPLDNFHFEFFAPDGREILLAAENSQLELWQAEPLRKRLALAGTSGAWSPDGKSLLIRVGAGFGEPVTYQIRDAADGALRSELKGACLAEWSPNARYVAAQQPCGTDHVTLIEAANGRTISSMAASYRPLWSGRRSVVPQYLPYLAHLLERGSSGRPPPRPELLLDPAHNVLAAASKAGVTLRTNNGQRVQLKGEVIVSAMGGPPNFDPALEFSPDGRSLAGGTRLWTLNASGAAPRTLDLPADVKFLQLLWSPDSRYLAFWNWIQQNEEPFKTSGKLVVVARDTGRVLISELPEANAAPHQRVVGLLSPSWLPHKPVLVVPVPGNDQLLELRNVAHGSRLWFALGTIEGAASPLALSADGRLEGRRELAIRIQQQHPELGLAHELHEEPGLLQHFLND